MENPVFTQQSFTSASGVDASHLLTTFDTEYHMTDSSVALRLGLGVDYPSNFPNPETLHLTYSSRLATEISTGESITQHN